MAAYETMFHSLSYYTLQLITLDEEQIRYFVKGMNSGIQMVTLSATTSGKSFQDMIEFAKKAEAIGRQWDVKSEEKKAQT